MRSLLALGTLVAALTVGQTAVAATAPVWDFELISVVPREPSVKPVVMPIPAREPNTQIASKGVRSADAGR